MKNRTTSIAVYPGTFDPVTNGHMDIIGRAATIYEHLIVGVAENKEKSPLFSLEERVCMIKEQIKDIRKKTKIDVYPFNVLLMKFVERYHANIVIRGLRAVSDFEYEFQMVAMNRKIKPEVEMVFLMADPEHQAISSRLVKEICKLGGKISYFVPKSVEFRLKEVFNL